VSFSIGMDDCHLSLGVGGSMIGQLSMMRRTTP